MRRKHDKNQCFRGVKEKEAKQLNHNAWLGVNKRQGNFLKIGVYVHIRQPVLFSTI